MKERLLDIINFFRDPALLLLLVLYLGYVMEHRLKAIEGRLNALINLIAEYDDKAADQASGKNARF